MQPSASETNFFSEGSTQFDPCTQVGTNGNYKGFAQNGHEVFEDMNGSWSFTPKRNQGMMSLPQCVEGQVPSPVWTHCGLQAQGHVHGLRVGLSMSGPGPGLLSVPLPLPLHSGPTLRSQLSHIKWLTSEAEPSSLSPVSSVLALCLLFLVSGSLKEGPQTSIRALGGAVPIDLCCAVTQKGKGSPRNMNWVRPGDQLRRFLLKLMLRNLSRLEFLLT